MALSGSFQTNKATSVDSDYPRYIVVNWSATQSIADNTSTISWSAIGGSDGTSTSKYVMAAPVTVTISGVEVLKKTSRFQLKKNALIGSGSIVVQHNSSGEASVNVGIQAAIYSSSVNCTYSGTIALDNIARASALSISSENEGYVYLNEDFDLSWIPASSSFAYKVKFSVENWSYTTNAIIPNSTSLYTLSDNNIPLIAAEQITSSTNGMLSIILYTYSNSSCNVLIGSTNLNIEVKIPESIVPTITSFTVNPVNTGVHILDGYNIYISGISKARLSVEASGAYGSNIESYIINDENVVQGNSSIQWISDILVVSSTGEYIAKTFKCRARDSRGRLSGESSVTVNIYTYFNPAIEIFSVKRKSDVANTINVRCKWKYAHINNINNSTATLFYKSSSSNAWTTYGTLFQDSVERKQNGEICVTSVADITDISSFFETNSYNFRLVVGDNFNNNDEQYSFISTINVLMDFRAGGGGLGIGKIAESDRLEVALDSVFIGDVYIRVNNQDVSLSSYIQDIVNNMQT